jgi:hypothetical protein
VKGEKLSNKVVDDFQLQPCVLAETVKTKTSLSDKLVKRWRMKTVI